MKSNSTALRLREPAGPGVGGRESGTMRRLPDASYAEADVMKSNYYRATLACATHAFHTVALLKRQAA